MISSCPVMQCGGREIHDDRILKQHVTDSRHQGAFDPVIGKRERSTLIQFGHWILTEHAGSQTCNREQLAGLQQKRAPIHVQFAPTGRLDYTTRDGSQPFQSAA